jgi:hypothetical protein
MTAIGPAISTSSTYSGVDAFAPFGAYPVHSRSMEFCHESQRPNAKGAFWVGPDTSITDIAKLMRKNDIGAVPIGENDRLIGMVTDRDILQRAGEGEL